VPGASRAPSNSGSALVDEVRARDRLRAGDVGAEPVRERPRPRRIAPDDRHRVDRPHRAHRLDVHARLGPRPEDDERARVGPRERIGGERGDRRGADRRQLGPVEQGLGDEPVGREQHVGAVDERQPSRRVARRERDELDAEPRRAVGGHQQQLAAGDGQVRPRRRRAGVLVAERFLERGDRARPGQRRPQRRGVEDPHGLRRRRRG
jgi:hypothetical protein